MRARIRPIVISLLVLATIPFILLMVDILWSSRVMGYTDAGQKRNQQIGQNPALVIRKSQSLHGDKYMAPGIGWRETNVKKGDRETSGATPESISTTCQNAEKCNPIKTGMLNVHLVPHSHLDVGWKKTMDQYYAGEGGGNKFSFYDGSECTSCLLDHVFTQLVKDPARRFMVVEMSFFSRWFNEQSPLIQKTVRRFVHDRRLEFIIGGWCMSDSANTYYDDIIDQHTLGFHWIQTEFGECAMSQIGWHIDQFGHSREHSSLFAQMGFDALFLGRIDFQDQSRRTMTRNMETIWRSSPANLGDKASMFTSVLYDGYFSPEGLGWEGRPPEIMKDDQDIEAKKLIKTALKWAESYKTKNVLIPFGGDFAFKTASYWYEGLDQLIKTVNDKQRNGSMVNALYSTPSCYITSVNKEKATFETMTTDFFPYSTIPDTFWTGFYTSRPGLKRHVKVASSLLQTCREVSVLARLTQVSEDIAVLKKAVAILQHHDAITGTEMQHVTDDYNQMLSEGERNCQSVISTAYKTLLQDSNKLQFPSQHFCNQLNISVCDVMKTPDELMVILFNPLGQSVSHWVRLPAVAHTHMVVGPKGLEVKSQLLPVSESTLRIPERGSASTRMEIVFKAVLPPVGFAIYKLYLASETIIVPPKQDIEKTIYIIENKVLSLTIDPISGLTKTLKNLASGVEVQLTQDYLYYISSEGETRDPLDRTGGFLGSNKRPSGAYVFSPKEKTRPVALKGPDSNGVKLNIYKGENVQEIHQVFSPWVSQVIRLYDDAPYLELEWTVGPIPEGKNESKDVVSRFTSDLKTNGVLYTDSNGRENMERRRNLRETWNLTVTNPVSGNYYPVTARMFMREKERNLQLTVLTDRSQGGASLEDGQMEIMVHRRTFKDDDMGVNEPLNERGVDGRGLIVRVILGKPALDRNDTVINLIRGTTSEQILAKVVCTHYLFLNTIDKSPGDYRPFGLHLHHPPTVSFMRPSQWARDYLVTSFSGIRTSLPYNVHLLTLEQIPGDPDTLLLRLENYFEKGETPSEDEEASVLLQHMFVDFDITTVRELSLGANHNITRVGRLQWKATDGSVTPRSIGSDDACDVHSPPFLVRLLPMEIRTFRVTTGPPTPPVED